MFASPSIAARAGLPPKLWHLDLDDFPGRVYGGPQVKTLAHRYCNRRAGAEVSNARQGRTPVQRRPLYDRW